MRFLHRRTAEATDLWKAWGPLVAQTEQNSQFKGVAIPEPSALGWVPRGSLASFLVTGRPSQLQEPRERPPARSGPAVRGGQPSACGSPARPAAAVRLSRPHARRKALSGRLVNDSEASGLSGPGQQRTLGQGVPRCHLPEMRKGRERDAPVDARGRSGVHHSF